MEYSVDRAIQILERTPRVLTALLSGQSEEWTNANEGEGTWSPYDVLGHLIEGERKDWMQRANIILTQSNDGRFEPFDRFAQEQNSVGKSFDDLMDEFKRLRERNLAELGAMGLDDEKLDMTGIHPEFGEVTLRQHLSTWVAHDLSHLAQINRILATQLKDECGPWTQYLRILQ